MRPRAAFLVALALGVAALLLFLTRTERATPPAAMPSTPATAPAPRTDSVASSVAPSIVARPAPPIFIPAPRGLDEPTRAAMHAKIKAWSLSKTGDTETQDRLITEFAELLTGENAPRLLEGLTPEEFDTPFSTVALDRWLQTDPAQAARWIAARPDARDEQALLVARRLMENPAELIAYSDGLPDGAWKENVLHHASLESVSNDARTALAFAEHMTPGTARTDALETITYDWAGRDIGAAMDWIKAVEDPLLRERLFAVGAKAIAVNDPDLAAGWLVSAVKSEGVLHETALGVIETWADQRPAEAANWVARFSEPEPRKVAIEVLLNHWLKSDPAAANAWIQTLPDREAVLAKLQAEQAERERPAE